MPTYEYECKSCGHNFEVFQAMSDEPLKSCPECGKEIRRLIFGGTGVIFKGSGFYVTDKSKSSSGPAKTAPSGDAAAKSSGTTETSSTGTPGTEKSPEKSAPAKKSEAAPAAKTA